jgi:putative ABC transport system permease protein
MLIQVPARLRHGVRSALRVLVRRLTGIAWIGCSALVRHKLRSFLTTLGLVIGVGCVIVVMAIGTGAAHEVEQQVNALGTNLMFIVPGATQRNGMRIAAESPFTVEDVDAIRAECPSVAYASPMKAVNAQIIAHQLNWGTSVRGVSTDWPLAKAWNVAEGKFFTDGEERGGAKVCLLGATVAENLFPDGDAVGQNVRVRNIPFKVIGVLERKGASFAGDNVDDIVLAPFAIVAKQLAGTPRPGSVVLSAVSEDRVPDAQEEIEALLRQRHRIPNGRESDFTVHSQIEIAAASVAEMKTMATLLLSIAAISLLVGGIGIMNVMLVSVTERTREIGIRMAIGAKGRHVLVQFLFEAVILTIIGGLIGAIFGIIASVVVRRVLQWPIVVTPTSIALSFGVAACVGIFFGFYPARKASSLDPIDALRFE